MENIFTERLVIRIFKKDDWKDLYEYLSDEEVVKFEPYQIFNEKKAKEEAIRRAGDNNFYGVCLRENEKLIGNLYFSKEQFDTWELGYVFNRKYQGQGYATESARALINYAFTNLNTRRVIAMCSPKNNNSWKLLERLGMRREGLLLQNVYFKTDNNGEPLWMDTYEYAILKSEWENLKSNI
jgi:RimJ/RimL family protein N-acetyltransferase